MNARNNSQLAADLILAGGEIATRIIDAMAVEHPEQASGIRQALEQGEALALVLTLGQEVRIELEARSDYGTSRRIGEFSLPKLRSN